MNFETFRSRLTVPVLAAFALGGVVVLHGAQGGQKPAGGAPLLIDFTAVGADGKPVEGLTPADVTIRVGGKPRTVTALDLKKVTSAAAPAPAAGAPAAAAATGDTTPPFATNEASAAPAAPAAGAGVTRSILIVIDNESLTPSSEAGMKAAVSALLEGLNPGDKVGLSTAPRDTAQVGFGTSPAKVREALTAVRGMRLASVSSADSLCRTSQTLAVLSSLLQQVAVNPTPTTVVFVASALSMPGRDTGSAGTCEVVAEDYKKVADMAAEARANFYIVQGETAAMGRNDGLENLASLTGAGAVMRVTGEGIAPRVLAAASTYWVATLAPDASDRPGQAQQLEVKAVKEGVTINARKLAASSRTPMAGAATAAAKPGPAAPKDMLASQAAYTDLQLRAATIVQRGQGDQMIVMVQAEPVDPAVKIKEMKVGFFDANNKGGSTDPKQVATYPITVPMSVASGQYRIRVAATDINGKSGAVDLSVNTALQSAGPLRVSGLMIGAAEGDKGMKPQLIFTKEPNVLVFLELYGQLSAGISVKFEVAKSDKGPALDTYPPAGGGPTNEPDKLQVFGQIPVDKLAAGDYVIRAVVQMEKQPEGVVSRTIRIVK